MVDWELHLRVPGIDGPDVCEDLKFFAKLIYVITGSCELDWESLMDVCVAVSQVAGYASIVCWLFAQLPQIIKNHERRSVDGVSLGFLTCWAAGDFLNFSSCLMTGAMAFQVLLSGYYCIIDVIIGVQYYYYSHYALKHPQARLKKNQRLKNFASPNSMLRHRLKQINNPLYHEIDTDQDGLPTIPSTHIEIPKRPGAGSASANLAVDPRASGSAGSSLHLARSKPASFSQMVSSSFIMGFSKVQGAPIQAASELPAKTVMLLDVQDLGRILAWTCTCLYLSSRIPQLITNYRQKTTRGVSILLFMAALSGNTLYSISLVLSKDALAGGDVTADFWRRELSYFLGASLTVVFDVMMLYQWYIWDYTRPRKTPRSRSGRIPHPQPAIAPVHSDPISLNDSSAATRSPVVMLSPKHARKLSELHPLSPQDFLIDTYLGQQEVKESDRRHPRFPSSVTSYGSSDISA